MKKDTPVSVYTILGLCFAFLIPSIVLFAFRLIAPDPLTNSFVLVRELALFFITGILILIIVKGEKLDLESIGLHNRHWGKSILWSFLIMIVFIAVLLVCLTLFKVIGISYGQGDGKYANVSLWLMTFMMLRAGIFEEIFYRGYIMERLYNINNNWIVYFLAPSVIFGLMHYQQGIGGIIIATVGGLVLSSFYWKTRDLKANIIAHFMIDFIPNVLIPLIGGGS
ncbi:MAG: type II CAAX endopeptidase family protein [Bacteroidia bacterium]